MLAKQIVADLYVSPSANWKESSRKINETILRRLFDAALNHHACSQPLERANMAHTILRFPDVQAKTAYAQTCYLRINQGFFPSIKLGRGCGLA